MANKKRTRFPKKPSSNRIRFPEVKGKIVEGVEIDSRAEAIVILFQDKTVLSFDVDPRCVVYPELSDWKTGNWKGIKRWPLIQTPGSMVKWP